MENQNSALLAEFERSPVERVRLTLSRFRGKRFVDLA